jgi:hypothetical protein
MIGRGKLVREVGFPFYHLEVLLIIFQAINRWIFETPEYEDLVLRKQDWEELEMIHTVLEVSTMQLLDSGA